MNRTLQLYLHLCELDLCNWV